QRRRVLAGHHDRRDAVLLRPEPAHRLDGRQAHDQLDVDRSGVRQQHRRTVPPEHVRGVVVRPGVPVEPRLRRRRRRQHAVVLVRHRDQPLRPEPDRLGGVDVRPRRQREPHRLRHRQPVRHRHRVHRFGADAGGVHDGGPASLPDIRFTGVQLANRVDTSTDQRPAMNWWRISYIDTETGDRIGVTYAPPDCVAGSHMPASPDQNTLRCYPVKWTPSGYTSPITDYFHTYIVTAVTETDLYGGSPRVITTYGYPGTPAWHYVDDNGMVPETVHTWSPF